MRRAVCGLLGAVALVAGLAGVVRAATAADSGVQVHQVDQSPPDVRKKLEDARSEGVEFNDPMPKVTVK